MKFWSRFVIFSGMLVASLNAYAAERELIIAGIPEVPLRFQENGEFKGLDYEIVDTVFKKLGIKTKVILENSSARLDKGWQSGDYDVVYCYSRNKEREEYLWYANESHITLRWKFWTTTELYNKKQIKSLDDLAGLRVGATTGYSYTKEFWAAGKENKFILDEVVKNELHVQKLLSGKIDVMVDHPIRVLYEANLGKYTDKIKEHPGVLKEAPYYTTFVKKSTYPGLQDLVKKYDETLKKMKEDGTLEKIYKKYGLDYSQQK